MVIDLSGDGFVWGGRCNIFLVDGFSLGLGGGWGSLNLVLLISSGGPGTGLFFIVISLGGSKVVHLT